MRRVAQLWLLTVVGFGTVCLLLVPPSRVGLGVQGGGRPGTAGRVLKLEELSFPDIDQIDRAKSIFFLTFGNLEEHGPHLPVGSDYFVATALRDAMIARLRALHPDYDFVLVPVVPLGEGGANDVAMEFDHIGTFAVRFETLRDVAIDLGSSIARKGFRNIFVVHSHGSPLHNIALSQAAALVSQRYKTRMVNITSLVYGGGIYSPKVMDKYLGRDRAEKSSFYIHAGAAETSLDLYVRGDAVKPSYRLLPSYMAKDERKFWRDEATNGWQGYWGDPARASQALGEELLDDLAARATAIAEKALAGEDLSRLPSYLESLPARRQLQAPVERLEENYARQKAEIEEWLRSWQSVKR